MVPATMVALIEQRSLVPGTFPRQSPIPMATLTGILLVSQKFWRRTKFSTTVFFRRLHACLQRYVCEVARIPHHSAPTTGAPTILTLLTPPVLLVAFTLVA